MHHLPSSSRRWTSPRRLLLVLALSVLALRLLLPTSPSSSLSHISEDLNEGTRRVGDAVVVKRLSKKAFEAKTAAEKAAAEKAAAEKAVAEKAVAEKAGGRRGEREGEVAGGLQGEEAFADSEKGEVEGREKAREEREREEAFADPEEGEGREGVRGELEEEVKEEVKRGGRRGKRGTKVVEEELEDVDPEEEKEEDKKGGRRGKRASKAVEADVDPEEGEEEEVKKGGRRGKRTRKVVEVYVDPEEETGIDSEQEADGEADNTEDVETTITDIAERVIAQPDQDDFPPVDEQTEEQEVFEEEKRAEENEEEGEEQELKEEEKALQASSPSRPNNRPEMVRVGGKALSKCLASLPPKFTVKREYLHNNIHVRLAEATKRLAMTGACTTMKQFTSFDTPHFGGGKMQMITYLKSMNWTEAARFQHFEAGVTIPPRDTVMSLVSCSSKNKSPWKYTPWKSMISVTPGDGRALKRDLFKKIKARFDSINCDYRTLHPESFIVTTHQQCEAVKRVLHDEADQQSKWFIKTPMESFGRGVSLFTAKDVDTSLSCNHPNRVPNYIIQRGVTDGLKVRGKITQGRAYLLVASLNPARVFFFDGYTNVAAVAVRGQENSRAAFVTNTQENKDSDRITPAQLMEVFSKEENLTSKEISFVRRRMREAALQVFWALRPRLFGNVGSYTLFGVDYIVQKRPLKLNGDPDISVMVLESNCNCELFMDPQKFGTARVLASNFLVAGMLDIVVAKNTDPKGYGEMLTAFLDNPFKNRPEDEDAGRTGRDLLMDPDHSLEMEYKNAESNKNPRAWNLIYSEKPDFSIMDKNACYPE